MLDGEFFTERDETETDEGRGGEVVRIYEDTLLASYYVCLLYVCVCWTVNSYRLCCYNDSS